MDPEMKAMFQAIMGKLEEHDRKFDELRDGLRKEFHAEIVASEERLHGEIRASEERTKRELMAYIENGVQRDVRLIAEGHSMLSDKLDRISSEVAELGERLENLEIVTRVNTAPIHRVK